MKKRKIYAADLFCGAGGTSQGLLLAANAINADLELIAVNHWQTAIDTHTLNHPEQQNLCTGLENVDPIKLVPGGRLHILCASPECTHHSVARGGKPMDDQSRSSPMLILDWLHKLYIDTVIIENVQEFQTWGPLGVDRRPLKSKRGQLFQAWIAQIKAMDYRVEWKVLNCADYGAPTTRKRLFIICRRGGKKISWPEPTHVAPVSTDQSTLFVESRPKWRTAREIIDWSRVSKDIFDRKKPLSPNTLKRISAGMLKFNGIRIDLEKCVREGLRPYLVVLRGTGNVRSVDEPTPTVTAGGNHLGLVQPFLLPHRVKDGVHDIDEPMRTVTATSSDFALVEPFTLQIDQTRGSGAVRSVNDPIATLVTKANTCIVKPFLIGQQSGASPRNVDEPVPTVATAGAVSLTEALLVPNFGEREGQVPRTHSIDAPAPAVTGHGAGALVEPFVIPQFSAADARSVERPLGTVTTTSRGVGLAEPFLTTVGGATGQSRNPQSVDAPVGAVLTNDRRAIAEPFLTTVNHGEGLDRRVKSVDVPLATVTGSIGTAVCEPFIATVTHQGGDRIRSIDVPLATVTASMGDGVAIPMLVEYYGNGHAQGVDEPVPTVTTKDRFALALPEWIKEGDLVYRLEIRFRMLQPRELARAQGFADDYQFSGNREAVVKQIGNAVPPPMAQALAMEVLQ